MENLIQYLNEVSASQGWPLSEACVTYLRETIKSKTLDKDEYLLEEGQVCTDMYFIQKGLLRCFYVLKDGTPVSDWFFWENEVVVSIQSFYEQIASVDNIQACEACELFYISFEELEHMYRTFVEFNVVGRVLTNKYLRIWHQNARNIRMLKAEDRYALLLEVNPELVARVPVADLASFLDMSKWTISHVRGRIN